jgi:hypothetical protein
MMLYQQQQQQMLLMKKQQLQQQQYMQEVNTQFLMLHTSRHVVGTLDGVPHQWHVEHLLAV